MLAINVSNYNILKCWRNLLATTIPRNVDNNKYKYSLWHVRESLLGGVNPPRPPPCCCRCVNRLTPPIVQMRAAAVGGVNPPRSARNVLLGGANPPNQKIITGAEGVTLLQWCAWCCALVYLKKITTSSRYAGFNLGVMWTCFESVWYCWQSLQCDFFGATCGVPLRRALCGSSTQVSSIQPAMRVSSLHTAWLIKIWQVVFALIIIVVF